MHLPQFVGLGGENAQLIIFLACPYFHAISNLNCAMSGGRRCGAHVRGRRAAVHVVYVHASWDRDLDTGTDHEERRWSVHEERHGEDHGPSGWQRWIVTERRARTILALLAERFELVRFALPS